MIPWTQGERQRSARVLDAAGRRDHRRRGHAGRRQPVGPARLGTAVDERIWDEREAGFDRAQRADGGFTSALRNPPAYYLYASLPYLATSSLGIFDQVFFMRLANIPLLLATVLFAWLIAGELFGRRRWLQTLATGAVALQPLLIHLAASSIRTCCWRRRGARRCTS